jgi:hypothetical protein
VTSCAKCGAIISRFAAHGDRYCWPCHPRIEAHQRATCERGHDLDTHGVIVPNGNGRHARKCQTCRRERDRVRAAHRRAQRRGEAA